MKWLHKRSEADIKLKREREELKKKVLTNVLDKRHFHEELMEALLIESIDTASSSADKLSRRVLWLNVLILIIGTLALLLAAYEVFGK